MMTPAAARDVGLDRSDAAATPTISDAVDTIPSFAPNTAALNQPTRET